MALKGKTLFYDHLTTKEMGRIGRKIAFRYCYVVRDPSSLDLE
jgi:hypothetical protein